MSGHIGQVLQYHLRFYQLLGLHGVPLSGDGQFSCKAIILRIWAGCLLSSLTWVAFMCVTSEDECLYEGDDFGRFNDGLKFGFAEVAVLSIYSETIWNRHPLARFWQLYAALAPRPAATVRLQLLQHWRFLITIYGTVFLESLMISVLFSQQMDQHIVLFWSTFQPFVYVVHLRNTQFVLHLELLRQQLFQLEHELALLVEYSAFASGAASFFGYEEYMRRRVRQKQRIYQGIYELYTCFIQAFSYSVLTVLLMIYVRIAVDCYFMYYTIYNKIDDKDYYLLLPALLEIPAFIHVSQSCMQMVLRIAYQLHSIVVSSPALSLQVQNFSLQLLHQPVRIHCLGITLLDSYLLTRIATAVCTYMIFTVQLMPKLSGSYY
ncbi:gustatory receptor 8a [Drosophila innubila]|uniref:gustatory receptor 8a n=1 Tax=Drosophila innubila TaxID=198719 RepID=UPI00148C0B19|nr:gustatory receptor 8a [Drosophila innubila]